jgi:hypothetical protein
MDLGDLVAKRQVLGKMAFKARLQRLIKTTKAKEVAANCVRNLLKTATVVSKKGGAASGS